LKHLRLRTGDGCARDCALPSPILPALDGGWLCRARGRYFWGKRLSARLPYADRRSADGAAAGLALLPGQCALIHTGGMLPDGSDAVVMVEHTQSARPAEVEVLRAAAPGENVLKVGEDVAPGRKLSGRSNPSAHRRLAV